MSSITIISERNLLLFNTLTFRQYYYGTKGEQKRNKLNIEDNKSRKEAQIVSSERTQYTLHIK